MRLGSPAVTLRRRGVGAAASRRRPAAVAEEGRFSATPQPRSGSTPHPFPTSETEGIQNPSEGNQNHPEQNQSPAERNQNPAERNPNLTSFHESSLFNGLSPTLTGRPIQAGATPT